jgi:hypothetical protein
MPAVQVEAAFDIFDKGGGRRRTEGCCSGCLSSHASLHAGKGKEKKTRPATAASRPLLAVKHRSRKVKEKTEKARRALFLHLL